MSVWQLYLHLNFIIHAQYIGVGQLVPGLLALWYSTTATPPHDCSKQLNDRSCCRRMVLLVKSSAADTEQHVWAETKLCTWHRYNLLMSCFNHRGSSGKSEDMKLDESSDMRHFQKDNRLMWHISNLTVFMWLDRLDVGSSVLDPSKFKDIVIFWHSLYLFFWHNRHNLLWTLFAN